MEKSATKLSKENKELRRQLEILKAQVKSESKDVKPTPTLASVNIFSEVKKETKQEKDTTTAYVPNDLLKTALLSAIVFVIIFGLYFSGKF